MRNIVAKAAVNIYHPDKKGKVCYLKTNQLPYSVVSLVWKVGKDSDPFDSYRLRGTC